MKTISIKELHAATGRWVRAATKQTIVVTDNGEKVAMLKAPTEEQTPRPVFTLKGRAPRPKIDFDSTIIISEDRDRW